MTYSIKEQRHRNPMWYFERNYASLNEMLNELHLLERGTAMFELGESQVEFTLLEETRYTLLIQIRHSLSASGPYLSDIVFTVRIYMDASLAEVISYQGKYRIQAKYPYPNDGMFQPDEKCQSNLLLFDWLSTAARLNYKETIIENCQN